MDEIDFKLLELLLKDGRMTFKELARQSGVDERLASRRLEKMVKEGVIKDFTVSIDWSKLGLETEIWIGTRTGIGESLRNNLFKFFNNCPNIVRVDSSVGSYEYVFQAICKNLQDFRFNIATPLEPYTAGLASSIITSPIKQLDYIPLLNIIKKQA